MAPNYSGTCISARLENDPGNDFDLPEGGTSKTKLGENLINTGWSLNNLKSVPL